jgi:hypothetical protein
MRTVVNVALLVYSEDEWERQTRSALERLAALVMHREMARRHGARVLFSANLLDLLLASFPWRVGFPGLRDVHQMLLEVAQRAEWVEPADRIDETEPPAGLGLDHVPAGVICEMVSILVHESREADLPFVLSWEHPDSRPTADVRDLDGNLRAFPVVLTRIGWAGVCAPEATWPDLELAVEDYYLRHDGLASRSCPSGYPLPFRATTGFQESVDAVACPTGLLAEMVKAVSKRVYGVLDRALGDEMIEGTSRFRVTRFYRIHYHFDGRLLVLDRFGPHRMDGID